MDINAEELIARIWDSITPGDHPHHRSPEYLRAVYDVEALIRVMINEQDSRYDQTYKEMIASGEIAKDA